MSKLQDLQNVTDAMYLRAQQSLRTVLLREAELRGELKKLDDHHAQVHQDQAQTIEKMRGIGADVLWEGWLARTRAALNMELAKTLAQKEQHIGKLRKSFGKRVVSAKLLERQKLEKSKVDRAQMLERAIEQSLWKNDQ